MSPVMVNEYEVSTSANADTVAHMLGKAWTANAVRARSKIRELGSHTYRFGTALNGTFVVKIESNETRTKASTRVERTRTSQARLLLLIPLGPKKIHINPITRNVMEKLLPQYLSEEGYQVSVAMQSRPLN
jgi:hypothetical protein